MPTPTAPFRLLPAFHERPWGVRSLAPWFDLAPSAPVGEAWFTAATCRTSLGEPLGALIAAAPGDLLGDAAFPGNEPLLLKLLFTSDRLSVQVHPDDAYARRHHGSAGKTEAWHVLRAEPGSRGGTGLHPRTRGRPGPRRRTHRRDRNPAGVAPGRAGDTFSCPRAQ